MDKSTSGKSKPASKPTPPPKPASKPTPPPRPASKPTAKPRKSARAAPSPIEVRVEAPPAPKKTSKSRPKKEAEPAKKHHSSTKHRHADVDSDTGSEIMIDEETEKLYLEFDSLSEERIAILSSVSHDQLPSNAQHARISKIEVRMKVLQKALQKLGFAIDDERYSNFMRDEGHAAFEREMMCGRLDEHRKRVQANISAANAAKSSKKPSTPKTKQSSGLPLGSQPFRSINLDADSEDDDDWADGDSDESGTESSDDASE